MRGLGDDGRELRHVRGRDGATVEAGEAEKEEPLLWREFAVPDEDSHHLPRVVRCTSDEYILLLFDALVELPTDVPAGDSKAVFQGLGGEVFFRDRLRLQFRQFPQSDITGKPLQCLLRAALGLVKTATQLGRSELENGRASGGKLCEFLKQDLFVPGGGEVVGLQGGVNQSLCGMDGRQWLHVDDVGATDELVVGRILQRPREGVLGHHHDVDTRVFEESQQRAVLLGELAEVVKNNQNWLSFCKVELRQIIQCLQRWGGNNE